MMSINSVIGNVDTLEEDLKLLSVSVTTIDQQLNQAVLNPRDKLKLEGAELDATQFQTLQDLVYEFSDRNHRVGLHRHTETCGGSASCNNTCQELSIQHAGGKMSRTQETTRPDARKEPGHPKHWQLDVSSGSSEEEKW